MTDHHPNAETPTDCHCGLEADTPTFSRDGEYIRDTCQDCALDHVDALTEPLPTRTDR